MWMAPSALALEDLGDQLLLRRDPDLLLKAVNRTSGQEPLIGPRADVGIRDEDRVDASAD
jgi:hypothetical protein